MYMHDIRAKGGNPSPHQLSGARGVCHIERRGGTLLETYDVIVRNLQQVYCRARPAQHGGLLAHSGIFSTRYLVPVMQYEHAHDPSP
jgi:hypothetical protein